MTSLIPLSYTKLYVLFWQNKQFAEISVGLSWFGPFTLPIWTEECNAFLEMSFKYYIID